MSLMELTVLFCKVFTYLTFVHSAEFEFGHVDFNTRLGGYVFKTYNQVSLKSCWHECSVRAKCSSLNYFRLALKCELNYMRISDIRGLSTKGIGSVYWERSNAQATVQCGANICSANEKCNVDTNTCLTKECTDISSLSTVQGNMNHVGSKAVVDCSVDGSQDNALVVAECQANGVWSFDDALTCLPVCDVGWNMSRSRCYTVQETAMSWLDAQSYCESVGANLVKVEDDLEQNFVKALAIEKGSFAYWIGLRFYSSENGLRWYDMSELGYTAWGHPREPDGNGCVDILVNYDWLWNDHPDCTTAILSICEKAPRMPVIATP